MSKYLIVFCCILISFANANAQCTATTVPTGNYYNCGGPATLTANSGTAYQWLQYGYPIPGATNQAYNPISGSQYSVIVYNGTCSDTSAPVTVFFIGPSATGVAPSDTTLVQGDSVKLCVVTGFPPSSITYQWYKDNIIIPAATYSCYYAKTTGTYSLITTENTCIRNWIANVRTPASVSEKEENTLTAAVVPNPSHGKAYLQLTVEKPVELQINIIEITGRMLWQENSNCKTASQQVQLPLSDLAAGFYLVILKSKDGSILRSLKLIKE